ncbi:EAL domain-containing protein [Ectothiorhodospiraceae bacterium WFHF3C12]|nr:EAL domain-containing protein [Ectothiorhodospiraceae bacterium WFHF3C12]
MSDHSATDPAYVRELERRLAKLEKTNAVLLREAERRAAQDGGAFDLFRAATALEEKVRERTARLEEAKAQLRDSLALVRATLEATTDGILVVDRAGRLVDYNERLLALWRLPREKLQLGVEAYNQSFVTSQLLDPEGYVRRTEEYYQDPESEGFDVVHLKDGRIFERYSVPQRVGGEAVGRVWGYRDVTEQRRAEQALRESEARLAQAQRIAHIGNWEIDLEDGRVWFSDEILRLFQIDPDASENLIRDGLAQLDPDDREEALQWNQAARDGRTEFRGEWRMTPADGQERILGVHARVLPDEAGNPRRLAGTCQDITEVKRSEGLNARLGRILDSSSNEIYVFEAESLRFVQANDSALANLGYGNNLLRQLSPPDIHGVDEDTFRDWLAPLLDGTVRELVFNSDHHRRDGSTYPVELHLQYSPEERPAVIVAVVQDITERRRSHERLYYLANFDELTGLPNRSLFRDRLTQAIAQARRDDAGLAVLFMDLDRFKSVNDTLGHGIGDELLRAVATRVGECLREVDTFARQGGDEFTVVLGGVESARSAAAVAEKILERFATPFTVGGHEIYTSGSIGITLFPDDAEDADGLLKNADTAMYLAKERGRGTYQFFTPDLDIAARERLLLEGGLRRAVENDELRLAYQPQVDLRTGAFIGFEALLRWEHPELGLLSPDRFIPIAEETGTIIPIGEWVLRQACAQWRKWCDLGLPPMTVSVNMSVRQFRQPDLASVIQRALREADMDAHWLELELTESMLMTNADMSTGILDDLKAVGARMAVDDFGTGYSSLNYLKRFPLDTLKIDRSFIKDIDRDSDDAEIARGIIALGRALQLTVLAEGVETADQRDFLLREGCHFAQGFMFGRPVAPEQATDILRASFPRNSRLVGHTGD